MSGNKRRRLNNNTAITQDQTQQLNDVQQTFEQFLNNENNPPTPEINLLENMDLDEVPAPLDLADLETPPINEEDGFTTDESDDEQNGGKRIKKTKKRTRRRKRQKKKLTKKRKYKRKTIKRKINKKNKKSRKLKIKKK